MVVLDPCSGETLSEAEQAAPACVCSGLEPAITINGMAAEPGCVQWLARWLCGAEIAFAAVPTHRPDFAHLHACAATVGASCRLEGMAAHNELPI